MLAQRNTLKDFALVLMTCTITKSILLKEAASFHSIIARVYASFSFTRNVAVLAASRSVHRQQREGQAQADAERRE